MIEGFFQNIWNWMEEVMGHFQDFVFNHYSNPIMWLCFFLLGIGLFAYTYSTLTKHK